MKNDTIPTSKLARTLKTTQILGKAGLSHLNYTLKKARNKNSDETQTNYEKDLGKLLFAGLSQMRGTALKVSQILSMETGILPEGVRKTLEQSCYQVPPLNKVHIRKVFTDSFKTPAKMLFSEFDTTAFAAASLGQVHHATTKEGDEVAVKVQYPNIAHTITSDLKILRVVFNTLSKTTQLMPNKKLLDKTLTEIEQQLFIEIDYEEEAKSTQWFYEHLQRDDVVIPRVYPELSNEKILTLEKLDGLHIGDWLDTRPTQSAINKIGQAIFDIFLYETFVLKALHADPHIGNYLILKEGQLGLLDFGCVRHLKHNFPDQIACLYQAILEGNDQKIVDSYKAMTLISEEADIHTYESDIKPIVQDIQQWLTAPFKHDTFDFSQLPTPPTLSHSEHKQAAKVLKDVYQDQLYFDRTFMGVMLLLKQLGATVTTKNIWIF